MTAGILRSLRRRSLIALLVFCISIVAGLTILRGVFAATVDLRVDEAYYWTWSKENVIFYLDHPPAIAWCIRAGTALFGDSNFGVRFAGLAAMLSMQLLLADIDRRLVHDVRYVVFAVLMPEASLHYGLGMGIGFHELRFDGPVGLYVAPDAHPNTRLWDKTGAVRQSVGSADLVWRGFATTPTRSRS